MTLQEIFDRVLIDAGAFIIGSADIELDTPLFLTLVKRVLGIYSKYSPNDINETIVTNGLAYTFASPAPRWISDVTPVSNPMLMNIYLDQNAANDAPVNFVWKYLRPDLVLPLAGTFNVVAVYDHVITAISPATNPVTYEALTISDYDDLFFKLLTGYFMVGLGRSRKAFTLNELPLTTDAADLVGEGTTLVTEGMTALQETSSKFYLAWS